VWGTRSSSSDGHRPKKSKKTTLVKKMLPLASRAKGAWVTKVDEIKGPLRWGARNARWRGPSKERQGWGFDAAKGRGETWEIGKVSTKIQTW